MFAFGKFITFFVFSRIIIKKTMSDASQSKTFEFADKWVFFESVDFSDESIKQYHIDTRDFHCTTNSYPSEKLKVFAALEKKPEKFIYFGEDLKSLLKRLYEESGGDRKWRTLDFDSQNKYVAGWECKYLRIYRVAEGLVVCNRSNKAINKETLDSKIIDPYEEYTKKAEDAVEEFNLAKEIQAKI